MKLYDWNFSLGLSSMLVVCGLLSGCEESSKNDGVDSGTAGVPSTGGVAAPAVVESGGTGDGQNPLTVGGNSTTPDPAGAGGSVQIGGEAASAGTAATNDPPPQPIDPGITGGTPDSGIVVMPPVEVDSSTVVMPPVEADSGTTSGGPPVTGNDGCQGSTMPPVVGEYHANGPLQTIVVNNTGPGGQFTIFKPTTLGANGNKHPIATWGNGITTTPSFYPQLLGAVASHGFVIIASNSTAVTQADMISGLDWMIEQNNLPGEYQDMLNITCLVTFGYSLGGGASVGAGAHENVVATASMHGVLGAANVLHAPLLLLTVETDTICSPARMVTPTFAASSVQTFYGTIGAAADTANQGHLIPVDGALALITPPELNLAERAAVIAWLRLWVYNDEGAKRYFYGDDCVLCQHPWVNPQRKNWQ